MDLNYLLHRHQVSLMRADSATGLEARHAHAGLARTYASLIDGLQRDLGVDPILARAA